MRQPSPETVRRVGQVLARLYLERLEREREQSKDAA